MPSARFTVSVCLGGVRSSDKQLFHVVEGANGEDGAVSLSVSGKTVAVDGVVQRALPSRLAAAVVDAIDASPAYAHSVHVLIGAPLFRPAAAGNGPAMGMAVVEHLVHAQHVSARGRAKLLFDECVIFGRVGGDRQRGGPICCETVGATLAWGHIQRTVLGGLTEISLLLFRYPNNRSAAVLLCPELSTTHIAALALAPRRAMYMYVDDTFSGREVLACVEEAKAVRDSVRDALSVPDGPTARDTGAVLRQEALAGTPAAGEASVSHVLDALARSDGEYRALNTAVERDLQMRLAQAQADRQLLARQLAEANRTHRAEMDALRRGQHGPQSRAASALLSTPGRVHPTAAVVGGASPLSRYGDPNGTPAQALLEAQRARQFAEEKVRLLEFKQDLASGLSHSRATSASRSLSPAQRAGADWDVSGIAGAAAPHPPGLAAHGGGDDDVRRRLEETARELAAARAAQRDMEATLQLQSRTIAEAKRAIAAQAQSRSATQQLLFTPTATSAARTPPRRSGGMMSPTRGAAPQ